MVDSSDNLTKLLKQNPTSPDEAEILHALRGGGTVEAATEAQELIAKLRGLAKERLKPRPHGERVSYIGDYELLGELGRGGMGIVYRAQQVSLQRDVALKMLPVATHASDDAVQRFHREAKAAATLDHPHIVPVYEVGEHEGQPYFSMKLVSGQNLSSFKSQLQLSGMILTAEQRRNRSQQIADLVEKIARAMHYAHQHGILHRDLKPSNVLVDDTYEPHITDFGLAKLLDGPSEMTVTGAILGTPAYMAPEQAAGSKDITTAADIYGMGAILYELLTGTAPFKGDSSAHTLRLVLESEPRRPRLLVPQLDRDLETICLKCMARDPQGRYASADALAEDLRSYRTGEPILARPISPLERVMKWARRRPAVALLAIVSLAACLVLVGGLIVSNMMISAARRAAESALEKQQDATYIKTIGLAYREVLDNNPARALALLDSCDVKRRDWEWHFTRRRAEGMYQQLRHGESLTFDVAYSPNGKYLAALTSQESGDDLIPGAGVAVFAANTGKLLKKLDGNDLALVAHAWIAPRLVISQDGTQLAIYGAEMVGGKRCAAVRRWKVDTWESIATEPKNFPDRECLGVVFDRESTCYALTRPLTEADARDAQLPVQVHNLEAGKLHCEFETSRRQNSPQLSPDGNLLALSCGGIDLFEFATGKRLTWIPLGRASNRVVFAPDGKSLACVENSGAVKTFTVPEGKLLLSIEAHRKFAHDVKFAAEGSELVSVGMDGLVHRWRASDGKELGSLAGQHGLPAVAIHPQSGLIAFPLPEDSIAVWSPTSTEALQEITSDATHWNQKIEFSADGSRLFILESMSMLTTWDVQSRKKLRQLKVETAEQFPLGPLCFAISPNGKYACGAIANLDNSQRVGPIRVWDLEEGRILCDLPSPASRGLHVEWANNNRTVAVAFEDHSLVAWDAVAHKKCWQGEARNYLRLMRHPTSGKLYAVYRTDASEAKHCSVIDFATGRERKQLSLGDALPFRFSPDGQLLAANYSTPGEKTENGIVLIEAATGRSVHQWAIGGSPNYVTDLSLLSGNRRLVSLSGDGDLIVWDVATHEPILNLRNPKLGFDTLAVGPQSLLVAGTFSGRGFYLFDGCPAQR